MAKPTNLPRWADTANPADVVEPTEGQKGSGWALNQIPPHTYFNWWKNLVYVWIAWLQKWSTGWVNVAEYGTDSASLSAAHAAAVAAGVGLLVTQRIVVASGAITLSVPVRFEGVGAIDVSGGTGNVQITGPMIAGAKRIFYTGAGTLGMLAQVERLVPEWWGAVGDGATDSTAALLATWAAASARGGAKIAFLAGRYLTGSTLVFASHTHVWGAGMRATVIQLKNGSNVDVLSGPTGTYDCSIHELTVDGNDPANATGRGIYWDGGAATYGPALYADHVQITRCPGDASLLEAVQLRGSLGFHFKNVHFENNRKARGLYYKGTDSVFDSCYFTDNGNSAGLEPLVVQIGAATRWINCYFGGSYGANQVLLLGAVYNHFIGCINDSAGWHGYVFRDDPAYHGVCQHNQILGGAISNPGRNADNSYDGVSFEQGSTLNVITGVTIFNAGAALNPTYNGRYGVREDNAGTATNNQIVGCTFGTWGTAPYVFRNGSTSGAMVCPGGGIPFFPASVNVTGPDSGTPGAAYIARFGNDGKIAIRFGASGYNYSWIQCIQDDGADLNKELRLQPRGGLTRVGGDCQFDGVITAGGLPNSNPGAGSKQIWYDPADGNRLKYAP